MKDNIAYLKEWWTILLQDNLYETEDTKMALYGLNEKAKKFGLIPFNGTISNDFKITESLSKQPSFKNTSSEILYSLIVILQNSEPQTYLVKLWSEKLLRFCEIKYPVIEEEAMEKWGGKITAQLGLLELGAFLLDCYFSFKDIRYLNTVLKLIDLPFIYKPKAVSNYLKKTGDKLLISLFTIRLVLFIEFALKEIEDNI